MLTTRFFTWMFLAGMMGFSARVALGQDYPSKTIRIVTHAAGGSTDFTARVIALGLRAPLGQPLIVDNRSGLIAAEIVAKAPPDGYTLLIAGGSFWTAPLLQKMPYDPIKNFSPITMTNQQPNILVVHPSVPVKSVGELISLAKAKPGELNYAASSLGSASHLAGELFKAMAGINIVHIPYKGGGPLLAALLGGQVQLTFATSSTIEAHLQSGRLRALAVASAEPSALFPNLPTVSASGLPGFQAPQWTALLAPANTSAIIVNRLNREVVGLLNQADQKERFLKVGVEAVGGSPEQLAGIMKAEIDSMGKLIKSIGLRVD